MDRKNNINNKIKNNDKLENNHIFDKNKNIDSHDDMDPRNLTKENFLQRMRNSSDEDIAFMMQTSTE